MFPVHPGRNLALELEARKMTPNALAVAIRVPASRIDQIVKGKRGISAETALRLGRYFGTGPQLWVNLQANYDLAKAERELGAKIAKEVEEAA
jgi:addiction module HigA family antidote